MQDVPVHHLSVNSHQCAQIDVQAQRVEAHQGQDVKEELGPQGQVLHNEGQRKHLSCLVPDEGLLWLGVEQLHGEETESAAGGGGGTNQEVEGVAGT